MNRSASQWKFMVGGLLRNRTAIIGLFITFIVGTSLILAPLIPLDDPTVPNFKKSLTSPSLNNFLGTDALGRDLLSRIIFGGRISLVISILAISFSIFLGISIGLTVGYFGGRIDTYVMRGIDALLAFPDFILAWIPTDPNGLNR